MSEGVELAIFYVTHLAGRLPISRAFRENK